MVGGPPWKQPPACDWGAGGDPGPDTDEEEGGGPEPAGREPPGRARGHWGSPWDPLRPDVSRSREGALKGVVAASPLFSPAPRTSSATRRRELSRVGRAALGTSQRRKYSRCGPPARGFWAGRVSRWWIWASNVLGAKAGRKREGEMERQRQTVGRGGGGEARELGSRHRGRPALPCPALDAGSQQPTGPLSRLRAAAGCLGRFQLGKWLLSSWSNKGCHRVPQTQRSGWGLLPGSLISIPGGLI